METATHTRAELQHITRHVTRWPTKALRHALEVGGSEGSPLLLGRFGAAGELDLDTLLSVVEWELRRRQSDSIAAP